MSAFRHDSLPEPAQDAATPHVRADDRSWARYLPDTFLTRQQHDQAMDRFFRYAASWGELTCIQWL